MTDIGNKRTRVDIRKINTTKKKKLDVLDEQTGFHQFLQITMKVCNSICGN